LSFNFVDTPILDLKIIQRQAILDERGFLSRLYCEHDFKSIGIYKSISQINQTQTKKIGVVRGLHYQLPPFAETKLISCIRGEVFDVAVDLRKDSPTYLKWHAEILSEKNMKSFLIPEGFAHGFQTLTTDCELIYFHTAPYNKAYEQGLNSADQKIGIAWPLEISEMSERDRAHSMIQEDFKGIVL
jgi:dTDP-4-dehydrorhamnose 3,5-epimerase